jgi:hypothetical protein
VPSCSHVRVFPFPVIFLQPSPASFPDKSGVSTFTSSHHILSCWTARPAPSGACHLSKLFLIQTGTRITPLHSAVSLQRLCREECIPAPHGILSYTSLPYKVRFQFQFITCNKIMYIYSFVKRPTHAQGIMDFYQYVPNFSTPTCFGIWLSSSGGRECLIGYSSNFLCYGRVRTMTRPVWLHGYKIPGVYCMLNVLISDTYIKSQAMF